MKVVKVLWIDSCNSNMNWTVAEDIEVEPMCIDSFGVVVKDTDEFLAIAQNYGDNPEQYSNITTIPKGCIKEVFVIHEDNVCENEQKTTGWSEEDNIMKQHCHQMLALLRPNSSELTKDIIDNCHHWLKSIKDRVQPKQEWSEEEQQTIKDAASFILSCVNIVESKEEEKRLEELADKLQDLRPQSHWKPSDEQITWLYRAADDASKDSRMKQILNELLSDLKKLKGE